MPSFFLPPKLSGAQPTRGRENRTPSEGSCMRQSVVITNPLLRSSFFVFRLFPADQRPEQVSCRGGHRFGVILKIPREAAPDKLCQRVLG